MKYQQPKELTYENVHLMCSKNQNGNVEGSLNQCKTMRQLFPSILFCWHSVTEMFVSPLLSWIRFVTLLHNSYSDKRVLQKGHYTILWQWNSGFSQEILTICSHIKASGQVGIAEMKANRVFFFNFLSFLISSLVTTVYSLGYGV